MENEKPKSINAISIAIIILFGKAIIGTFLLMMYFQFFLIPTLNTPENLFAEMPLLNWLFNHIIQIGLITIAFESAFLLGGIYLLKLKSWARTLLTIDSVVVIILNFLVIGIMFQQLYNIGLTFICFASLFVSFLYLAPFVALIIYLNQKSTKILFAK